MYVQQPNDMTHYSNTDSDMVNQLIYVHQLKDMAFIFPDPGPSGALPGPEFHIKFFFSFLVHQVFYQVEVHIYYNDMTHYSRTASDSSIAH
jgi:hypothetical protein